MFDFAIVCYLFLGGLGGGLCAVASLAVLSIPGRCLADPFVRSYPKLLGASFFAAAAVLVLAGMVLLADAGISSALVYLFFPPSPNYLSIGSWLIVAATALCLVSGFVWRCGAAPANPVVLRFVSAAGALAGLGVALYTGLFLSAMPAVALWHTPWLPALFVLSSLSCGAVSFAALMRVTDSHARFRGFERTVLKADLLFAALEAVCAGGFFGGVGNLFRGGFSGSGCRLFGGGTHAWRSGLHMVGFLRRLRRGGAGRFRRAGFACPGWLVGQVVDGHGTDVLRVCRGFCLEILHSGSGFAPRLGILGVLDGREKRELSL